MTAGWHLEPGVQTWHRRASLGSSPPLELSLFYRLALPGWATHQHKHARAFANFRRNGIHYAKPQILIPQLRVQQPQTGETQNTWAPGTASTIFSLSSGPIDLSAGF